MHDMKWFKWFLVLLAVLGLVVIGVGCSGLTGPQRLVGAALCKAQCPIAKSLALRGCAEIEVQTCVDEADQACMTEAENDQVLYDACVDEVEALYGVCVIACDAAFAEPEPEPSE